MIDFLCFLPLPRFRPARLPNQLLRAQDSTEHDSSTRPLQPPRLDSTLWNEPSLPAPPPLQSPQDSIEQKFSTRPSNHLQDAKKKLKNVKCKKT